MFILSGAHTLIGNALLPLLRDSYQTCAIDHNRGSIVDEAFVGALMDEIRPDVFINCEELSDPVECEYRREEAYRINALAPGMIARFCKERNITMVQFSSAYVFDGASDRPYTENETPRPIQAYGDSKLLGEQLIQESGCEYLIIRISDIYDAKNSPVKKCIESFKKESAFRILREIVSPLNSEDAARAVFALLKVHAKGTFHCASREAVPLSDFIRQALGLLKAQFSQIPDGDILEINEDYESLFESPRLRALDPGKSSSATGQPAPGWRQSLEAFMQAGGCSDLITS